MPEEIGADLRAVVGRRNVVVHHSWRFYLGRRAKLGDTAVAEYTEWFAEQAAAMGHAYNGVMTIVFRLGENASPPDDAELAKLWRGCVPAPVEDVSVPELDAGS